LRVLDGRDRDLNLLRQSELVVVGGTGFVGSWIAEMVATLNDEYKFNIKLSLISRNIESFSNKLTHLSSREDISLVKSDVRDLKSFPMEADWVIHAAANPDVRAHATRPLDTGSVIVDGTMAMMRISERLGRLKKILYLSSGLVCGSQLISEKKGLPESVQRAPALETSCVYANAKRFAESICSAARAQSRIPVLVARPFSFIGPYQSLETPWAQTTFLSDALQGHSIRVLGDGQVMRSYLYGSDVAFWFLKILIEGKVGDVVNVGSPVGTCLRELATCIAENFDPSPDIIFNTSPHNILGGAGLFPDTTHAETKYNLSVFTPIDEAVKLTVEWHRMQMNGGNT